MIPKDSIRPEADAGSRMGVDDCDGEETSDSSREFYLYFICEEKENNDREIDATIDLTMSINDICGVFMFNTDSSNIDDICSNDITYTTNSSLWK